MEVKGVCSRVKGEKKGGGGRTGIREKNSRKKEYHALVHSKSQFLRWSITPDTAVI